MFTGILNAVRLAEVLKVGLISFIRDNFTNGHRLFHDNDPKHSSKYVEEFLKENGVNWWPTPPESPYLNPIENMWGSLKQYLRSSYKPRNLEELKRGIEQFWLSLTPEVCRRYIRHLDKVIPKVIELNGDPSGF